MVVVLLDPAVPMAADPVARRPAQLRPDNPGPFHRVRNARKNTVEENSLAKLPSPSSTLSRATMASGIAASAP